MVSVVVGFKDTSAVLSLILRTPVVCVVDLKDTSGVCCR